MEKGFRLTLSVHDPKTEYVLQDLTRKRKGSLLVVTAVEHFIGTQQGKDFLRLMGVDVEKMEAQRPSPSQPATIEAKPQQRQVRQEDQQRQEGVEAVQRSRPVRDFDSLL
ncbi:hypothetical protein [Geoalkalibacter halelectricus]|uniref:hypothetical protein n=1 Tax=Geoalkalibacter halelectricus TaxID=2847045 RepID=UPI00266F88E3|nr:hypothetical protein [Geoalkalibacter halelectricus]MDO3380361.1 hypothetical protein [Geoalkalibacter halelectricus]